MMHHRKRQNTVALFLLCMCFQQHATVSGAVSTNRNIRREAEKDEKATDGTFLLSSLRTNRGQLNNDLPTNEMRSPSRLPSLVEKAHAITEDRNSSFVAMLELEETAQHKENMSKPTKKAASSSQTKSPIFQSGLVILALASFVFTNHSSGFKALKELMTGSLSALSLVWLPTILLQGRWMDLLSLATLLTQPAVRTFVRQEFLPKALVTLKKLCLTEIWRRIWARLLVPLPKPLFVPHQHELERILWLPQWVKESFHYFQGKVDSVAQSMIKSSVQQSVHGTMGIFYESVSSSMFEISFLYEDSTAMTEALEEIISVTIDADAEVSESEHVLVGASDDDSAEPELVCDGDSCRWE